MSCLESAKKFILEIVTQILRAYIARVACTRLASSAKLVRLVHVRVVKINFMYAAVWSSLMNKFTSWRLAVYPGNPRIQISRACRHVINFTIPSKLNQ